jgi:hypothetical protein
MQSERRVEVLVDGQDGGREVMIYLLPPRRMTMARTLRSMGKLGYTGTLWDHC